MSRARSRELAGDGVGTDRGRRVRRRFEPACAPRRGRGAASSAGRSSSSSPIGRARRSTGRAEQGIDTALVPDGDDATLADALAAAAARRRRPRRLHADRGTVASSARSPDGSSTPIPSLLPAFPGRSRGPRRPARMARPSPAARSISSTRRSTAARSSPRRPSRSSPATTSRRSMTRIRAVEHRLLPRAVALLLAGAIAVDGRRRDDRSRPRGRAASRGRAARSCRSRTRPASSSLAAGSSPAASSWSRPAGRRGRCARPACR